MFSTPRSKQRVATTLLMPHKAISTNAGEAHDCHHECRQRTGREILLEVDGGVKIDNITDIARAGADTFVAGSAIFGAADYRATIAAMRARLAS